VSAFRTTERAAPEAAAAVGSAFPRVLFLTSSAFNHLTGGGITFSNLFAGWPKDRLATVHNDTVATSDDVCDRYFVLGRPEIDLFAPLRIARRIRDRHAGVSEASSEAIEINRPANRGLIARVQGDSAPQRVRLTARVERWIADFRPQLLFTLLGSNAFMELATAVRRRFAVPMVVHLMDDFPSINYRRGVFAPLERARMKRLLADNLQAATTCLGICDDMCTAFSQRYRRHFVPFQNCVDVERWRSVVRTTAKAHGPEFRLLYFGSVFANAQVDSLVDLCRAVARLNAGGMSITLDIASPSFQIAPYREVLAIHPAIRLIEPTRDDGAYFTMLAATDALMLPINFDSETVDYIRYSMPTKVPAYMASGTPILVYGPREVAQVAYAARQGWGHVEGERDPEKLDAALRRILLDDNLRESLRLRAQACARDHHDSVTVRTRFQHVLKAAAGAVGATARR
jgi:glycosyltransferase involved in cell wall biosynthesis